MEFFIPDWVLAAFGVWLGRFASPSKAKDCVRVLLVKPVAILEVSSFEYYDDKSS